MSASRRAIGAAVAAALVAAPCPARAARPLFEPTDLALEESGVLEVDLQMSLFRTAQSTWKAVVPDVEIDLGVVPGVELDVDFAHAIVGVPTGRLAFASSAPDNVWSAAKLGLWSQRTEAAGTGWSLVTQLGPRLPTAPDTHGVGGEALVLVGRSWPTQHAVLNLGGAVDPAAGPTSARTAGLEAGLDFDVDLAPRVSMIAEVATFVAATDRTRQLHATCGFGWDATDALRLSASWLAGLFDGEERFGVLVGVTPKLRLWR